MAPLLEERANLLSAEISELARAAMALKPITTENGIAGHEKLWNKIAGAVGDLSDDD